MKDKIISLIKEYRAESGKNWNPITGYQDELARRHVLDCDEFADKLERLLESEEEE